MRLAYVPLYIVFVSFFSCSLCGGPQKKHWTKEEALYRSKAMSFNDDEDTTSFLKALSQSMRYYRRLPEEQILTFGKQEVPVREMLVALSKLSDFVSRHGMGESLQSYVHSNFVTYKTNSSSLLLTGYYEALLKGSRKKSKKYYYPLYRKPSDLEQLRVAAYPWLQRFKGFPDVLKMRKKGESFVPYYSREEIDVKGSLAGRDLELCWVDDEIDAFFLHIQGSGIVQLEDGSSLRVNYADKNGHPYRAIGAYMIRNELMDRKDVTMQSLENYLREHPEEREQIFNFNPSYVFFREVEEGPLGNIDVPLTADRSIATDRFLFPKGALALLVSKKPVFNKEGQIVEWKPFTRLVFNQDTGGAIRGPGRADLFTGNGERSEAIAGSLKERGSLYFLAPK